MAAGVVGNQACLLENVVHEYAAETPALLPLVDSDLSQEEHRDLTMIGRPSWPAVKLIRIHHAKIDCVVAQNP